MVKKDSFIFYRSFYVAAKSLSNDDRLALYDCVISYALDQEENSCENPLVNAFFTLIKPQLDANHKRYENGSKGGRPAKEETETKPKRNRNETETKPNKNKNVNKNDNVNVNKNVNVNDMKLKFLTIDVDLEFEKFNDYCEAKGKRYKNKAAGFRNWCRNAEQYKKEKENANIRVNNQYHKPSQAEQIAAGIERLNAEYGSNLHPAGRHPTS